MKRTPNPSQSISIIRRITFISLTLLSLLFSCRKADLSSTNGIASFDVAAAKEWWYGTFRKSADFRTKTAEPYGIRVINKKTANLLPLTTYMTRYPVWSKGRKFSIGKLDMIEMPLYTSNLLLPVPLINGEDATQKKRRINASFERLLIVKDNTGKTMVRIVSVVPDYGYAQKRQFDFSNISVSKLPADFEGFVFVKTWQEQSIKMWRYKGGKRNPLKLKENSSPKIVESVAVKRKVDKRAVILVCETFLVEIEHFSCVYTPNGDEPDRCDDPDNWTYTYSTFQLEEECNYQDDGTGGGNGACDGAPDEEACICQLYGLGCEDGGGGGSNGLEITIDINNLCIRDSYDKLDLATSGVKSSLLGWANTLFGHTYDFNLTYSDGHILDANVFATWSFTVSGSGSYNGFINIDDSKLTQSSKEWQVYALLHELYHGYLATQGFDVLSTNDHNLFSQYRSRMINQLMLVFPLLSADDAYCLSWGGLQSTVQWGNLSPAERDRIGNIINSFINNTTGTPC